MRLEIVLSDSESEAVRQRIVEIATTLTSSPDKVKQVHFLPQFDEHQFFTPDRIRRIEAAEESVKSGKTLTAQEVREHFDRKYLDSKESKSP